MTRCIICKAAAPDPRKPEHILLNALGGRYTTTKALCSICNNALGSGPDQDLADSVKELRNIANLKSGHGQRRDPPTLKIIDSEENNLELKPGGRAIPILNKRLVLEKSDEKISGTIYPKNEDELRKLLKAIPRKLGITDEKYEQFISHMLKNERCQWHFGFSSSSKIPLKIKFGNGKSQQSMAKACLVLWNELVGNAEVCSLRYDPVRSFILSNKTSSSNNHAASCVLDHREVSGYDESLETHPNIIWVGSNDAGRVLGYFRLYNMIGWRFELTQADAPANRSIYLACNPFNTGVRVKREGNFGQISFEWLEELDDGPKVNYENCRRSLNKFLLIAEEKMRYCVCEYIVNEALSKAGISEGDYLTDDDEKVFLENITMLLVSYLTQTPCTIPLDLSRLKWDGLSRKPNP